MVGQSSSLQYEGRGTTDVKAKTAKPASRLVQGSVLRDMTEVTCDGDGVEKMCPTKLCSTMLLSLSGCRGRWPFWLLVPHLKSALGCADGADPCVYRYARILAELPWRALHAN